ncbi:hypothetical protein PS928_02182 [Pseudomonas fluorescens]|uniref:Uncharacterized protein n=1 Tax=Pseudomonas fluorescens TaxID=294 RepID=A0A5E7TM08_PSEFL|nr:hypothetical protein PS928_02182 [Pseudomonas fluorescens]
MFLGDPDSLAWDFVLGLMAYSRASPLPQGFHQHHKSLWERACPRRPRLGLKPVLCIPRNTELSSVSLIAP